MKPICFYHKSDLDGVCSAAIVKHFVPDCELFGRDYGEDFDWDKVQPVSLADQFEELILRQQEAGRQFKLADAASGIASNARRTVYLVDFSLKPEDMKRLAAVSNLVWIDHHKTAIDAAIAAGFDPRGMRSTRYAACELCWTWCLLDSQGKAMPSAGHCYEDVKFFCPPEAVRLLGAYDSWRKDDPEWDSKIIPFQYGMRAVKGVYDPACGAWEELFRGHWLDQRYLEHTTDNTDAVEPVTLAGSAILDFQSQQNRKIAEAGAFEKTLVMLGWDWVDKDSLDMEFYRKQYEDRTGKWDVDAGFGLTGNLLRCICLNTPLFSSQSFEGVWDPEKHDVMVAFAKMATGKWKVSLYSTKPEIDCGAIAKTFSGGGHKGAAGFVCDKLPWEA